MWFNALPCLQRNLKIRVSKHLKSREKSGSVSFSFIHHLLSHKSNSISSESRDQYFVGLVLKRRIMLNEDEVRAIKGSFGALGDPQWHRFLADLAATDPTFYARFVAVELRKPSKESYLSILSLAVKELPELSESLQLASRSLQNQLHQKFLPEDFDVLNEVMLKRVYEATTQQCESYEQSFVAAWKSTLAPAFAFMSRATTTLLLSGVPQQQMHLVRLSLDKLRDTLDPAHVAADLQGPAAAVIKRISEMELRALMNTIITLSHDSDTLRPALATISARWAAVGLSESHYGSLLEAILKFVGSSMLRELNIIAADTKRAWRKLFRILWSGSSGSTGAGHTSNVATMTGITSAQPPVPATSWQSPRAQVPTSASPAVPMLPLEDALACSNNSSRPSTARSARSVSYLRDVSCTLVDDEELRSLFVQHQTVRGTVEADVLRQLYIERSTGLDVDWKEIERLMRRYGMKREYSYAEFCLIMLHGSQK